ncbi:ATP-binding cassette domain-containing protein [Streptomyces sp. NPDC013457]|uniref:ABC transporter ATP-binding protein n=1 Tax=Streptomyces sp. NPDC013457 TaxID=3364866 RepID=UPI0036FCCFCE
MEANPEEPHGAAVVADGFGLKGPRGWVFREVGFRAEPGALVAIEGPSGSGRTCLLLALTGRMKPQEGHAEVAGHPLPRRMAAVRRISSLGPVPGVSDLDPSLTVAEHLRERALLQRRYDGAVRALLRPPGERAAATRARIDAALEAAGLDLESLPKGERTSVRDLERLEALRLSVALALIGRPRLLALDDTDLKLSAADRAEAWALLRSIADAGTTVLAVCSEAPEGALKVTTAPRIAEDTPESGNAVTTTAGADRDTEENPAKQDPAKQDPAEENPAEENPAKQDPADGDPAEDTADATAEDATDVSTAGADAGDANEDTTEEGEADALAETGRA